MGADNFQPACYALRMTGRLSQEVADMLPPAFRRRYERILQQQLQQQQQAA